MKERQMIHQTKSVLVRLLRNTVSVRHIGTIFREDNLTSVKSMNYVYLWPQNLFLKWYCKEIIKDKHKVTSSECVTSTSQNSALAMALQRISACFPGWPRGFFGMVCRKVRGEWHCVFLVHFVLPYLLHFPYIPGVPWAPLGHLLHFISRRMKVKSLKPMFKFSGVSLRMDVWFGVTYIQ